MNEGVFNALPPNLGRKLNLNFLLLDGFNNIHLVVICNEHLDVIQWCKCCSFNNPINIHLKTNYQKKC